MWTPAEIEFLATNYPQRGKAWCVEQLGKTEPQVRSRAALLGLRQDRSSLFFADWQQRAAADKVGKKRPEQATVMRGLHAAGKLKLTDAGRLVLSSKTRAQLAANHPKGMLGKRHGAEARDRISVASLRMWGSMSEDQIGERTMKMMRTRAANGTVVRNESRGTWKAGWREIGGKRAYFRSRWEANYAWYLEWLKSLHEIREWEHEPETFWFEKIRRGCVSYLPDFRVTTRADKTEYHEVKGWMDARSKTKIRRMSIHFPAVKLLVIDGKAYAKIRKAVASLVPGWEA